MPQDAEQKTAKTQPFPRTGEFIPHIAAPAREIARVKGEITGPAKKVPVVVAQEMFTPPTTKHADLLPAAGRQQLAAVELQPEDPHVLRLRRRQYLGVRRPTSRSPSGSPLRVGAIAGIGFRGSGTFTAIDATSGKIVWQKTWPEPVQLTSTTAGNIVFVGRNAGELQAYNAENGDLLWSFQTGAGANNTPTIFEHGGKEYLAYLSAGNSLMATAHGDSLWLFGLDGTMGPAAAPGKGQGTEHKGEGGGNRAVEPARATPPPARRCSTTTAPSATGRLRRAATAGPT